MNISNNYYGGDLYSIEIATLASDLIIKDFKKIKGKFFLQFLHPSVDARTSKPKNKSKGKYKESNYLELEIPPHVIVNCVKPKIRTLYIDANGYVNIHNGRPIRLFSMEFKKANSVAYKIPKGTEFLVETLNGSTTASDFRILSTAKANPKILEVAPNESKAKKG